MADVLQDMPEEVGENFKRERVWLLAYFTDEMETCIF